MRRIQNSENGSTIESDTPERRISEYPEELVMGWSDAEQGRGQCACCGGACAACGAGREAGVRVRVLLRRGAALVWAPRARCVRWLAARLRRHFALRGRFALASRGRLLPAAEPLALLERDDPVEIIPLEDVDELEVPILTDEKRTQVNSTASTAQDETDYIPHFIQDNQNSLTSPRSSNSHKQQDDQIASVCESQDMKEDFPVRENNADSDHLIQLKRQALELLDKHYASSEVPPPKRSRRRRRRRRPQSACHENSDLISAVENHTVNNIASVDGVKDVEESCELAYMVAAEEENSKLEIANRCIDVTEPVGKTDMLSAHTSSEEELSDNVEMLREQVQKRTVGMHQQGVVHDLVGETGAVVVVRNDYRSRAPRVVHPLGE